MTKHNGLISISLSFVFLFSSVACISGREDLKRIQDAMARADRGFDQFAFNELSKFEASKTTPCPIEQVVKTGFLDRSSGTRLGESFVPVVADTKCGQKKYYFCKFTERKCTSHLFRYLFILIFPGCVWGDVPVEGLYIVEEYKREPGDYRDWCENVRPPESKK